MRYMALACDYDGTLAGEGIVHQAQIESLQRLQASGRKLILVTGRLLENLLEVFPQINMFDSVVCENGGVLYKPATRTERLLGEKPPEKLVARARELGVSPMNVGRSIIDTRVPNEKIMYDLIKELGLEWQVIFNIDAVMVLPPGVNKAFGLKAALKELGLSAHNAVGIGDAENDHALLKACELSAAVANAIPSLKETADFVSSKASGEGVDNVIQILLADDFREQRLSRHYIKLGSGTNGNDYMLRPYHSSVLVAGASGSGKSTVATLVLERLVQNRYQFCLIDPEGDYQNLENAVSLGGSQTIPTIDEVMNLLQNPSENAVINLLGVPLDDRPGYFASLVPHLHEFHGRTGRPHWLVIDEAHHLLADTLQHSNPQLLDLAGSSLMVTVHPEQVCKSALATVDTVMVIGRFPEQTIKTFCTAARLHMPDVIPESNNGNIVLWDCKQRHDPVSLHVDKATQERRRHRRKYAQGDVGVEKSFVFRGPDNRLKLKAQNLQIFLRMAEGVDEDTWLYHLRRQDYSHWFQDAIKDEELATLAAKIEIDQHLSAEDSISAMKQLVEHKYGAPE